MGAALFAQPIQHVGWYRVLSNRAVKALVQQIGLSLIDQNPGDFSHHAKTRILQNRQ